VASDAAGPAACLHPRFRGWSRQQAVCDPAAVSVAALVAWIVTAVVGLYLLAIWLIEYDPDFQRVAATRLPVTVVCGHVLLAVGGLLLWLLYLITNERFFCWAAASDLAVIATLGFTMAIRWLGVYRARPSQAAGRVVPDPDPAWLDSPAPGVSMHAWPTAIVASSSGSAGLGLAVPPERHFPVSVVIAHGIFAVTTVTLVVLIVIGVGGS
jgi:hypothetical protein